MNKPLKSWVKVLLIKLMGFFFIGVGFSVIAWRFARPELCEMAELHGEKAHQYHCTAAQPAAGRELGRTHLSWNTSHRALQP